MASIDIAAKIDEKLALNSTAISSATTTNGNTIDLKDAESLVYAFTVGATVAGTFTPLIQDSPDGSTWTAVADDYLVGTEAGAALTTTNTTSKIGYIGKERYSRFCVVTTGGSVSGTAVAIAIIGDKSKEPIA